jgi:hypothetical protein
VDVFPSSVENLEMREAKASRESIRAKKSSGVKEIKDRESVRQKESRVRSPA